MEQPKTIFRTSFFLQSGAAILLVVIILLHPGRWSIARWVGLAIAIPAAALLIVARYQLGMAFSVAPKARILVTHGLYARIRNPMYVFSVLLVFGLILSWGFGLALLLWPALLLVQTIRARREARVLQEKFGAEYEAYRAQTWF